MNLAHFIAGPSIVQFVLGSCMRPKGRKRADTCQCMQQPRSHYKFITHCVCVCHIECHSLIYTISHYRLLQICALSMHFCLSFAQFLVCPHTSQSVVESQHQKDRHRGRNRAMCKKYLVRYGLESLVAAHNLIKNLFVLLVFYLCVWIEVQKSMWPRLNAICTGTGPLAHC